MYKHGSLVFVVIVQFLHLNFSVTVADYIISVADAIVICLIIFTRLLIPVYAVLVSTVMKTMLVVTFSIV